MQIIPVLRIGARIGAAGGESKKENKLEALIFAIPKKFRRTHKANARFQTPALLRLRNIKILEYWAVNSNSHCVETIIDIKDSASDGRRQR